MRKLNFSLDKLRIEEVVINGQLKLDKTAIVLNLSKIDVFCMIDNTKFSEFESRIVSNQTLISEGASVCIISIKNDNYLDINKELILELKEKWSKAFTLFPNIQELAKLEMYKSPKDRINGYELNLWYLAKNSYGRIHKQHDFTEVHLQVAGIGKMQKYSSQKRDSLYETAFMFPGYTHYPFYDKNNIYPWHSFDSLSDCIWLAIERH